MTKTQNSHHVARAGKSRVKHRRGWSRRNRISSYKPLERGTTSERIQMMNRSIQGNPVLPMMIRKLIRRRGRTAYSKETILSGVRVNPRSLKAEAEVKMPLQRLETRDVVSKEATYHQVLLKPSASAIGPHRPLLTIHGTSTSSPSRWKPTK